MTSASRSIADVRNAARAEGRSRALNEIRAGRWGSRAEARIGPATRLARVNSIRKGEGLAPRSE